MRKTLLTISFFFLFNGCSTKEGLFIDAKKHMIESQKLQRVIHELDVVKQNEFSSELEKDDKRSRYALTLADTLSTLSEKIETASTHENDKLKAQEYLKKSQALFEYANDVKSVAQDYQFEKLSYILKQVDNTCQTCHDKYRREP
jgi:cytochrome c556